MMMTQKQFEEYENTVNNAPDKSAFFDRYYAPDAVFVNPFKGTIKGKMNWFPSGAPGRIPGMAAFMRSCI